MIQSVNKYPIDNIFKKDSEFYFFIPKYQREYTWGYREWEALYNDLYENAEGYFIGSIICINEAGSLAPQLEVIDGQQRLTTICLFLTAIYALLKDHKNEIDEDNLDELPALKKALICSKSNFKKLILVPQIQSNNKADFAYLMYENGIITEPCNKELYAKTRKIYRCFDYFKWRISQDIANADNAIQELLAIKKKVYKAMLVLIEVSSHSDAYILFESLNHRGTPLSAVDLMKNLIMAKAEKAELTIDDCFDRWQILIHYLTDDYTTQERFFRHYYNAFKNILNKPFVYDNQKKKAPLGAVATRSNLLTIYEKLINNDLVSFLEDILKCGHIYSYMISPNEAPANLKNDLLNLSHIEGSPSYLLLMYLFRYQEELQISDEIIAKVIKLLTIFFVRRNVTDTPNTRDLTRIFMTIISELEENEAKGIDAYAIIHKRLEEVCASDTLFEEYLKGDIYKDNAGSARFILCTLAEKQMTKEIWTNLWEQKTYERSGNKYVWTIEHIFPEGDNIPQCWVDMIAGGDAKLAKDYLNQYVHKLGNLTMTGYNSNLSNLSFEAKRDRTNKDKKFVGYKNGLEINKSIAEKESWTIEDITTRTELLVKQVMKIFKFPEA